MADSQLRVINNITKEYPDMIKVVIFKNPEPFMCSSHLPKRKKVDDDIHFEPSVSSLTRTKILVQDIVLCNDFELFCTFTFDPKKVDRYNYGHCQSKMSRWLHHQRQNSYEVGKEFKYLIIPEKHKDGAYHFHALISGYTGTLHRSKCVSGSGRPVYNLTSFRSGFTTAVEIDDKAGVSSYVTKYITKSFVREFNRRRFQCSRNLTRPTRTLNSSIFSKTLPLFRKKVSESESTETYILPVSI